MLLENFSVYFFSIEVKIEDPTAGGAIQQRRVQTGHRAMVPADGLWRRRQAENQRQG